MSTAVNLFSSAQFRKLAKDGFNSALDATVDDARRELEILGPVPRHSVFAAAYEYLRSQYRNEYFYKNLIASKIFVGRHRAANAVMLQEVPIASSIADAVIVNGRGVVYEIKTELDSPQKLQSQLANYYQAFPYVVVVVHERDAERYAHLLRDTPAGITALTRRGNLRVLKHPTAFEGSLSTRAAANLLRHHELQTLLNQRFGRLDDVPNALRYEYFLDLASRVTARDFQVLMQEQLKERSRPHTSVLLRDPKYAAVRSILIQLQLSAAQTGVVKRWLDS